MLKSCKYCGRIHDSRFDCGKKPRREKIRTKQNSFRSTEAWKRKSIEIRERDHYLCQICVRKRYGTVRQYNNKGIEVHHIVPIAENWDSRLDNEKLLSLCETHHEMAERGEIPRRVLLEIAGQQEEAQGSPHPQNMNFPKCATTTYGRRFKMGSQIRLCTGKRKGGGADADATKTSRDY